VAVRIVFSPDFANSLTGQIYTAMLFEALLPIVVIIALGFALARTSIAGGSWELLERLTYYLFFPALLVGSLANASVSFDLVVQLTLVLGAALLVLTVLLFSIRQVITRDRAAMSSVYQGSIRFNTYIGLAIIEALFGDSGLRLAAVCLLIYIPMVNILSVLALSLVRTESGSRISGALISVVSNPLVLACATGLVLSETRLQLPGLAETLLQILSQPALPLGLLAVGAGIRFVALGSQSRQLIFALAAKLLILPALILAAAMLLRFDAQLFHILLLLTALPAPPSAYILARQLGGDASLMANIISIQSLAALLFIPFWIGIAERFF
jgi:predicted permease